MTAAAQLAGLLNPSTGKFTPANQPAGSVIQVVSATLTTQITASSNTWADILSATITPNFSSSKIWVVYTSNAGSGNNETLTRLQRNGSNLPVYSGGDVTYVGATMGSFYSNNAWGGQSMGSNYLDSPSTTSAVTYKIQGYQDYMSLSINRSNGTNTGDSQGGITTLTLIEIAG